jgi:hypothetical protein
MGNHLLKELQAQTVERNGVPMYFVHVVAGFHLRKFTAPLHRQLRVGLQCYGVGSTHADERKNLSTNPKHQHIFIEGNILSNLRKGQTGVSDPFQMQNVDF